MAVVERVEAAPGERRRLRLANPATLEPLGELEIDGADHVRAAVERARKAQPEWGAASFRERAHFLDRAARLLAVRADEFAARITAETGKPRAELLTRALRKLGCESRERDDGVVEWCRLELEELPPDDQLPLPLARGRSHEEEDDLEEDEEDDPADDLE